MNISFMLFTTPCETGLERRGGQVSVRQRLHEFMQTALMESICACIIFTNSVLIGVQTDYMAKRVGESPPLIFIAA